jgi:hypothetical protein
LPETSRLASTFGPIIKSADKVIGRHRFEAVPVLRFDELDCEGIGHELTMRPTQVSMAKRCSQLRTSTQEALGLAEGEVGKASLQIIV